MKIKITEDQHDKVVNTQSRHWIRRNIHLVNEELKETFKYTKNDVCRYDTYEKFEGYFFAVLMDCLHQYYMEIETHIYRGLESELTDLFYVECTEFYFDGRRKC